MDDIQDTVKQHKFIIATFCNKYREIIDNKSMSNTNTQDGSNIEVHFALQS